MKEERKFTITRYVNGVEVSKDDLSKFQITNPTLDRIFASINQRLREAEEREAKEHEAKSDNQ